MPQIPVRDGLCRLSAYLEELEAVELKKFKLYLGTATEPGEAKIPRGRMEQAGPLEMAQLLVAHCGMQEAWLLALSIFERINRKDLWERGRREDLILHLVVCPRWGASRHVLWKSFLELQEKIPGNPTGTTYAGNSA